MGRGFEALDACLEIGVFEGAYAPVELDVGELDHGLGFGSGALDFFVRRLNLASQLFGQEGNRFRQQFDLSIPLLSDSLEVTTRLLVRTGVLGSHRLEPLISAH